MYLYEKQKEKQLLFSCSQTQFFVLMSTKIETSAESVAYFSSRSAFEELFFKKLILKSSIVMLVKGFFTFKFAKTKRLKILLVRFQFAHSEQFYKKYLLEAQHKRHKTFCILVAEKTWEWSSTFYNHL